MILYHGSTFEAEYKQQPAPDILREWDGLKLTDFIFDMYEMYHSEDLHNAFADIDSLMTKGAPAW